MADTTTPMRECLHRMLALLEGERAALASLDLERILTCADGKQALCDELDQARGHDLDEECRGLLDAVKRLNDINRKLRNLIAANIQARLGALTGTIDLYRGGHGGGVTHFPR